MPVPTTVAVNVTLPPEEMVEAELVTVVEVVCPTVKETVHYRQYIDSAMVKFLEQIGERDDASNLLQLVRLGLEHEMQQHSWLPGELTPELVFKTPPEAVWEEALRPLALSPGMIVSGHGASA